MSYRIITGTVHPFVDATLSDGEEAFGPGRFLTFEEVRERGRKGLERIREMGFDRWLDLEQQKGNGFGPGFLRSLREEVEDPRGFYWERDCGCGSDGLPDRVGSAVFRRIVADVVDELSPVFLCFDGSSVRTAETLSEMINGLNPKVVQRSQKCTVRPIRTSPSILRWTFGVRCNVDEHVVKVKVVPRTRRSRFRLDTADLRVSCSCPFWVWYGSEWHANTKKYLDQGLRGSGTPPDVRDPERQNMMCKHLYAVLQRMSDWTLTLPDKNER